MRNKIIDTMKYSYLNYLLVFSLIFTLSCEDYLNLEPKDDLIKQEFWNTKEDVLSVLAATYSAFRSCSEKSLVLGEIRADMITVGATDFADYDRIASENITSTNGATNWKEYYKAINLANTVMYFMPIVKEKDNSFTDKLENDIKSQMLFIRALSYFYLVRIWKEVPLVTQASISDTVNLYLPKQPEHVVIKHIISDLKTASAMAKTNLSDLDITLQKGTANKYSIQALLADVLLWDEQYEQAIVYCDSIINTGKFGLQPTATWFDMYYPGNSTMESIFEIQYDDNLESQHNPMYDKLFGSIRQTSRLNDLFNEDNDVRYSMGYGPLFKYVGINPNSGNIRSGDARDANFIYYRYADILFMKAEALAETGNMQEANNLVREIAERAGEIHDIQLTYDGFINALMDERAREFAIEGKRWFDLLRWAKKDNFDNKQVLINVILTKASNAQERAILKAKVTDTMSYYLPIYERELTSNNNLIQNPFYRR